MLAKDLIKYLEDLIERNKPYEEMLGELEIVVDKFSKEGDIFYYVGYDKDIELEFDITSGRYIINAFAEKQNAR